MNKSPDEVRATEGCSAYGLSSVGAERDARLGRGRVIVDEMLGFRGIAEMMVSRDRGTACFLHAGDRWQR
jgi:hypothetical protein